MEGGRRWGRLRVVVGVGVDGRAISMWARIGVGREDKAA